MLALIILIYIYITAVLILLTAETNIFYYFFNIKQHLCILRMSVGLQLKNCHQETFEKRIKTLSDDIAGRYNNVLYCKRP